jgi:hypothetical protein
MLAVPVVPSNSSVINLVTSFYRPGNIARELLAKIAPYFLSA